MMVNPRTGREESKEEYQKRYMVQTYEEYLETMKAYHFYPQDRELWAGWQKHYHGEWAKT